MAEWPYWMQHGGHYRPISDLSTPWVPSPLAHAADTAPYTYVERVVRKRESDSISDEPKKPASPRKKRSPRVPRFLRVLVKGKGKPLFMGAECRGLTCGLYP